jgi:uncharacterized protein
MNPILIGRKKELSVLRGLIEGNRSEFIALYGRRRVGKTYLIRKAFEGQITFQVTGLANATTAQQITNFHVALQKKYLAASPTIPSNWFFAFQELIAFLEKQPPGRKVIFIDELPWFDTHNSGFIQAIEHFWNSWASARYDIILVACGSAASWMINKLLNNKGGLHNRVTKRLKLVPFTLHECEQYVKSKNAVYERYQIVQLYMVLGGIPYYWDEVDFGLSAEQNIETICFTENGLLRTEFSNLFSSLFYNSERHTEIVNALAQKAKGLTRNDLIAATGKANSGRLTELLDELEQSGFIRKYAPFGKKTRHSLYQLVDFYVLFYLRFMKDIPLYDENNWSTDNPKYRAWSGYAFEQVCLSHIPCIKKALGIAGVQTMTSSWRSNGAETGAQIDLVIDRRDQIVNLCEIKFSINDFTIDKKYAEELRNKISTFKQETGTRKSVFLTFISSFKLKTNAYSMGLVQNHFSMDILFQGDID